MKHFILKTLSLALIAVVFTSCNGWKELAKDYYTVTPDPLEVNGGKVSFDINAQIPAQVFKKTYALKITPELVYGSSSTALPAVTYQGENFPGNNTVIPYDEGKAVTYSASTPYKPEMEKCTLVARLTGLKGKKAKELGTIELAKGVITTALSVKDEYLPSYAPSEFVRDTDTYQSGLVHFLVNSAYVRPAQLKTAGYKALCDFVKMAVKDTSLVITGVEFIGHASPEGEATLNENLSIDRAKAVEKYFQKVIEKAQVAGWGNSGFYTEKGEGADWDGFFELLANSSISDKDMIKRTLDGEPLLSTKEKTLKSLESTYGDIHDKILPELRRTEIRVKYTIKGRTDEQIHTLAIKEPNVLTANELIYAAEALATSEDEQIAILKNAIKVYPNDYRGYNNMGVALWDKGDREAAINAFGEAAAKSQNDITANNTAVARLVKGDVAGAKAALAKSNTDEAAYNKGIIAIMEGDYKTAAQNMNDLPSYDTALAQLLAGDNAAAIQTLNALGEEDAQVLYLKAVAYARGGQNAKAKETLAKAAAIDPTLSVKAQNDMEFRNLK